MDETRFVETMRTVLKKELNAFATKDDLKTFVAKDNLKAFATKDDLKAFATKDDLKAFATKDDLKAFATKDDLKAFATKDDLKAFATKDDFLEFEKRISSFLQNVRDGMRLSVFELEQALTDIKSKLRFYDFDFLVKQNEALIKILHSIYEERTITNGRLKDHEKRLETIESMVCPG